MRSVILQLNDGYTVVPKASETTPHASRHATSRCKLIRTKRDDINRTKGGGHRLPPVDVLAPVEALVSCLLRHFVGKHNSGFPSNPVMHAENVVCHDTLASQHRTS